MPVLRPSGRCLVVASGQCQPQPLATLQQIGFECVAVADPYAAMIELMRRPLVYRSLVLSLQSLYREELSVIATIKRRLPHLEVWITQASGREAALIEAMRLGADGLLDEEGFHRTGAPLEGSTAGSSDGVATTRAGAGSISRSAGSLPAASPSTEPPPPPIDETSAGEPVLTADELRALLQEQPSTPGGND